MSNFPSKQRLIEVMQTAYWNMPKDDHLIPDDSQIRVETALNALLTELPCCEDSHSAAYCYEKLEAMRGDK